MLDQNDLKWIAATSTELNSLLQQVSRYSDLAQQKGEQNHLEMLGERVERAARLTQSLFDRVTSSILAGKAARPAGKGSPSHPPFSILPSPGAPARLPVNSPPRPAATLRPAPAVLVPRTPSPIAAPDLTVRNPKGPRELLLVVEDDADVAELAAQMLAIEGYKVILAKDGFEALKIYGQLGTQIRLVILDFFLPILDGDAVFEELRALNPDVAVVLSSGFAEQTKLGTMLARGLRGFIPKPYERAKLLEQVRSTLDSSRQAIA